MRLSRYLLAPKKPVNGRLLPAIALLLFGLTVLGTTHSFRWTMMALLTFVLAYLTKGIRRRS